jgi:hypothetical protein
MTHLVLPVFASDAAACLGTLFVGPLQMGRTAQALMLLPLCLAVSLVVKTLKTRNLGELPLAVGVNFITIVLGMYAVGAALFLLYELLA